MKKNAGSNLLSCAHLILPWLAPSDLAAASAACKALHRASSAVTAARSADAARNLEPHLIPFMNSVDSHPYSYFRYTPSPILATPSPSQPWGGCRSDPPNPVADPFLPAGVGAVGVVLGCGCDECVEEDCPCWGEVMECGAECGCGVECGNRITQRGVNVRLMIVKDRSKGWGLHAGEMIRRGEFVCEYAGEFLTTEEARRRQQIYDELAHVGRLCPALLVVREHLPSGKACLRVNIDATKIGNVARFINHSCDGGNLSLVLVRNYGSLLPRLCFFAASDIPEGKELTFSYGDARLRQNGLPCVCGSSLCLGMLPSEET